MLTNRASSRAGSPITILSRPWSPPSVIAQPQFDDEEDPAETKRINESIEIAKELMQSENPMIKGQGYLLMGLAKAKRGRPTEG